MAAPFLLLKPPFTPRKLAGLRLWLSADRIAGLADGDPVSTWSDLSGNSNHATQGTTAAKPLYKANIVNGRPAVLFDGVDDWLALAAAVGTILTSSAKTVFAVVKMVTTANNSRIVNVPNAAGSSTRFALNINATPQWQTFYTTGAAAANFTWTSGAAPTTSVAQILEVVQNGTSILGRLNGTQGNSASDGGGEAAGTTAALGSSTSGGSGFSNAYILEFVVYNRALSTTETAAVRRYLGARYGVAVA